ncbi:MAG: winged helix-turn-helix domain-containing protein [Bacillota bacterium]
MSNQAEQIIEGSNDIYSMKGWQASNPYGRPVPEEPTGETCPVSLYRAAMISRSPGRVHELVRTLSENCFDVMVMRRWEPLLQSALNTGLILVDMTVCRDMAEFEGERNLLIPLADRLNVPVMYLVSEELMSRAGGRLLQEELMVWPPRSKETLLYQVQRAIRVHSMSASPSGDLTDVSLNKYKDLWIDRDKMIVQRGQTPIHLTKTEYSLFILLMDSEGAVRTREELMSEIWDTDFLGGSNVVDVHIKSLRKKLNDNAGSPRYIATVRGVGYRLAD